MSPRVRLFSVAPLFLFLALIWPFGGGRTVHMMAGASTPGATATISIKNSGNGNTSLDIRAKNLAPPSSLTPAENVYVVWIQPPDKQVQNEGQLRVDHKEQGELHMETAFKQQNAQTQEPMGPHILSADVAGN